MLLLLLLIELIHPLNSRERLGPDLLRQRIPVPIHNPVEVVALQRHDPFPIHHKLRIPVPALMPPPRLLLSHHDSRTGWSRHRASLRDPVSTAAAAAAVILKFASPQRGDRSENEQAPLRSRQPHVQPFLVGQKTNMALFVVPYGGEDDDVLFSPFKAVHRLDLDVLQLHRTLNA